MILQISSGTGSPEECQLAVEGVFKALQKEYEDMIELLSQKKSKRSHHCTSILFSTELDLSELDGTIQWICKSPLRPSHKRKNWFIDISIIPEKDYVPKEESIRWEKFHCGGKGGQNVNKVETGVRLIHLPTGIVAKSTEERSQYANKRVALRKLKAILDQQEQNESDKQNNSAWYSGTQLVRGNPVRIYEGLNFKRKV